MERCRSAESVRAERIKFDRGGTLAEELRDERAGDGARLTLRVNLHFHVLWTDGVFAHQLREGRVEFCEHDGLTDAAVGKLVRTLGREGCRVWRWDAGSDRFLRR